ncbi:alginate O-acetyltransferase AlgX-related protein [Thalassoroseus pseudoceratinae]|uniref:alginate O-acetyltransferase AlgX-related protein n=1 Tax=Thalassoroseus pseudoceratinae TaxID=2713176 RepID=UPI001422ABF1|nr:hypothetical protein [Thalassoroseus pseudoceratinae]
MTALPTSRLFAPQATRTAYSFVIAVMFFGLLSAPLFGLLQGGADDAIRENENRNPAKFPTVELRQKGPILWPSKKSLSLFPRSFERWFNDHRGFRQPLLGLYNLARSEGLVSESLGQMVTGEADRVPVIIGREGWLYCTSDRLVDEYRGTHPFTQDGLDRWKNVLLARKKWLAERGISYIVVFAPNKNAIYPEYMPRAIHRVTDTCRLDQLKSHLQDTDLDVIDLRAAVTAMKSRARTYHRTDTHWNEVGAFAGYQEVMQAVSRHLPGEDSWTLEDFEIQTEMVGNKDLARMLQSPEPYIEEDIRLVPLRQRHANCEMLEGDPKSVKSTNPSADRPNIVVVHDSFMTAMAPFLNEHFEAVQYEWQSDFPKDVIERERPALVIHEYVQRRLMSHQPEPGVPTAE